MSFLFGADARVANWVAERVGATVWPPFTAIGITDEHGGLVGGLVFNDYNGANVEITGALDRPLRPGEARGIGYYVFRQLGCRRVTFRTKAGNERAARLLSRHMTIEARLRGFYADDDGVQYVLHRDACRYLPKEGLT